MDKTTDNDFARFCGYFTKIRHKKTLKPSDTPSFWAAIFIPPIKIITVNFFKL